MATQTAIAIVDQLHHAGMNLSLSPSGGLEVRPASQLTPDLRDLVRQSKFLLIEWLSAANCATYLPAMDRLEFPAADNQDLAPTLRSASLIMDAQIRAVGLSPDLEPDNYCWPQSTAMNGAELDLFAGRMRQFTDKGVLGSDAEALADKLVLRDRESDDRQLCLECAHLGGYGGSSWRCGNRQAAGVAIQARNAQLPADLVVQLQRCDGFAALGTRQPNTEREAFRQD
jgi:hypothetical protein